MRSGRHEHSIDDILHILCAPEPTDDLKDISFDPMTEAEEEAERDFIRCWLEGRA